MTKKVLICISFLAATFLSSTTMAEEHLPENLSDETLEVVLIELKE